MSGPMMIMKREKKPAAAPTTPPSSAATSAESPEPATTQPSSPAVAAAPGATAPTHTSGEPGFAILSPKSRPPKVPAREDFEDLDHALRDTLVGTKDRDFLLEIDAQLWAFAENDESEMSFEDLSTWHRLLVHRVADRYGLERVIGGTDGNDRATITVQKVGKTVFPVFRLEQFIPFAPEVVVVEEQPTILARRPKQKKQQQRQKVDELAEDLSHLTVEEQEQYRIQKMHEEYQKAKERIFGKEEEPSAPYPVASEGDSGIQVQDVHKVWKSYRQGASGDAVPDHPWEGTQPAELRNRQADQSDPDFVRHHGYSAPMPSPYASGYQPYMLGGYPVYQYPGMGYPRAPMAAGGPQQWGPAPMAPEAARSSAPMEPRGPASTGPPPSRADTGRSEEDDSGTGTWGDSKGVPVWGTGVFGWSGPTSGQTPATAAASPAVAASSVVGAVGARPSAPSALAAAAMAPPFVPMSRGWGHPPHGAAMPGPWQQYPGYGMPQYPPPYEQASSHSGAWRSGPRRGRARARGRGRGKY